MFANSKIFYLIVCVTCFANHNKFSVIIYIFLMFYIFQKPVYFDNDPFKANVLRIITS